MKARAWPTERVETPEGATMAYRIDCGCGAVAYYPMKRGVKQRTPESIPQHFRSYGWQVGHTVRKDRCPECMKREPSRTEEKRPMPIEKKPAANVVPLKADPPPEMSRADRQIVFAKISDVYATNGYVAGWTDRRVAEDLNVPLAWVRDVRDQFFGAEGSNPIIDEFSKAAAAFNAEWLGLMEVRKRHLAEGVSLRNRLDDLDAKAREIASLAKRVEKEIGR